jgi:Domain of unknown function (DUF4440)
MHPSITLRRSTNRHRLILLMLLFIARIAPAGNTADSSAIVGIEQQLLDAITAGDSVAWRTFVDPSCIIVAEDGSRNSRADIIASLHPFPDGYSGHITITSPHMTFGEQFVVLQYVADEHEEIFGQQLHTTYATTNVYARKGGSWQIVSGCIFEIPKLPAPIALSSSVLDMYAGTYQLAEGIEYTITTDHGRLFGERTGRQKQELMPETENVFFTVADTRGRKLFLRDREHKLYLVDRRNGNDLVWKKIH